MKVVITNIKRPRCSCCEVDAVATVQVKHTIFRGEDEHYATCAAHLAVLRDSPEAFERLAHLKKQQRRDAGKRVEVQPLVVAEKVQP